MVNVEAAFARPIEHAARTARVLPHAPHDLGVGDPLVLQFDDEDFTAALRGLVARAAWPERGWPQAVAARALLRTQPPQTLHQPVHRRFNLVLTEVTCAMFGAPPLNPAKIAAAGLVVRRYVGPRSGDAMPAPEHLRNWRHWQGWFSRDGSSLGWQPFASATEIDADPDPAQRPAAATGNAVVDALIAERTRGITRAERVHPLHALPPDTLRAAGRTLLFGLVPVTSDARAYPGPAPSGGGGAGPQYGAYRVAGSAERTQLLEQLSAYLKAATKLPLPRASSGSQIVTFDTSWLAQERIPELEAEFILMVRQLAADFGAFDTSDPARALRWRALLDSIPFEELRFVFPDLVRTPIPGYEFLRECARVLENPGDASIRARMPDNIGPLPDGFLDALVGIAVDGFEVRAAGTPVPSAPFDDPQALYAVRAFVRAQPERAGCAMRTAWSEPSPLYRIAPWYAAAGRVPAPIPMPPADRETLRRLKPNAAFAVPPSVHSLFGLNGARGLLGGGIAAPRGGITWVWQLSIPVMTICALVAMHIVLFLLDVVFRWVPFAKIVFPLPKRE